MTPRNRIRRDTAIVALVIVVLAIVALFSPSDATALAAQISVGC